jgi:peptidoglycan/LPS O-acetylase OafA/YrhL
MKMFTTVGFTLLAMMSACFLLVAVTGKVGSPVRRVAESRVLRFLGKYSYGLYAIHIAVYAQVIPRMSGRLVRWTGSKTAGVWAADGVALAVAILVALGSWHLFEKHFLKLKRYFGGE